MASGIILADIPGRMRRALQAKSKVRRNPQQPWANFIRETRVLRIKTSDDEIYRGRVSEWSRAGRPKEVRLKNVERLNPETGVYLSLDQKEMLFLEKDIDRLLMLQEDDHPSVWARFKARVADCGIVVALLCGLCDWWRGRQELETDDVDTQEIEAEEETAE